MAPVVEKNSSSKRKAESTKEPYVKGAKKSKSSSDKPEKKSKKEDKPDKKAKKVVKPESEDDAMSVDSDSEGGVQLNSAEAEEDTEMGEAQDGIHPERRAFAAGQGPNGMQVSYF